MKKPLLHTIFLFTVASCFGLHAFAQENLGPLYYNPNVAKHKTVTLSTLKTTALTLPFFEDFTNYTADPDSSKWMDRQVYINNTMGANMISRGVATFDALNQYGKPYDTLSATTLKYADSLTVKPIDLSAYVASDSLYLSFFYQPGGNGFVPEKNDSLLLYFKPKTGISWTKIWGRSDSALRDFRQVMIPITNADYLYSGFQFRFVNRASIGNADDIWNIDYIRLDAGRNMNDTLVNDVAFTLTPGSILNDYTSMPYQQYLANASGERAAKFQTSIKNNFTGSQNIANFGYQASEIISGASLSSDAGVNRTIPGKSTSDIIFNTYSAAPSAGPRDRVIFENKFNLQAPAGDTHAENDTIVSQQIFDNYLAYDDGTAEQSYYLNLGETLPGKLAVEHHLNQADTLRGLAIYFGRQVPLATSKYFSIVVYKSIAYGSSTSDNVLYDQDNLIPSYVDTINHFWIYKFEKPLRLEAGTFYIGTTQPAMSGSSDLYFGWDANRITGNHLYYNTLNLWSPSVFTGSLMIRPLLGADIKGTGIAELKEPYFSHFEISPNPATNTIQLTISDYNARFEIKDLSGKKLIEGRVNNKQQLIDISGLPNAMYLVEVFAEGKQYTAQKFLKQ